MPPARDPPWSRPWPHPESPLRCRPGVRRGPPGVPPRSPTPLPSRRRPVFFRLRNSSVPGGMGMGSTADGNAQEGRARIRRGVGRPPWLPASPANPGAGMRGAAGEHDPARRPRRGAARGPGGIRGRRWEGARPGKTSLEHQPAHRQGTGACGSIVPVGPAPGNRRKGWGGPR